MVLHVTLHFLQMSLSKYKVENLWSKAFARYRVRNSHRNLTHLLNITKTVLSLFYKFFHVARRISSHAVLYLRISHDNVEICSLIIGSATKWLRILSIRPNDKTRNHLVAKPIYWNVPNVDITEPRYLIRVSTWTFRFRTYGSGV